MLSTGVRYRTPRAIHYIPSHWVTVLFSCVLSALKETNTMITGRPTINKKAVLSQRWPRDARYISRSWAVADIWPFEIIQDSGGRHLEFIRIENSAIRSAVPEKPTLEQNLKWIGRPVAEIWPFQIFEMRGQSSVGRSSTYTYFHWSHILLFATLGM